MIEKNLGWVGFQKSYVIFRVGHDKWLRLLTRWVGGVKKGRKYAYVILEWSLRWLKVHIFSEYMNFNIRRYFHVVHLLKRIWQITILNFFTLGWKVKISNLAHFCEDGTKGKIPSKIKSLAGINQLEKLKLNEQYRFIGLFVKAQSI